MSWVDIRQLAPPEPEGYSKDPMINFLPKDFHGQTLSDFGQGVLSHNMDPWFQQFESQYLKSETPFFGVSFLQKENLESGEIAALGDQAKSSAISKDWRWRFAVVNADKMRLTILKKWDGKDIEMICESLTAEQGVRVTMNRSLNQQVNLGLNHQTALRHSQLLLTYQF